MPYLPCDEQMYGFVALKRTPTCTCHGATASRARASGGRRVGTATCAVSGLPESCSSGGVKFLQFRLTISHAQAHAHPRVRMGPPAGVPHVTPLRVCMRKHATLAQIQRAWAPAHRQHNIRHTPANLRVMLLAMAQLLRRVGRWRAAPTGVTPASVAGRPAGPAPGR